MPANGSIDLIQTIIPILVSIAISAAISIGVFIGTTRTKIKSLEDSIKATKTELEKEITREDELIKKEFEGKINLLDLRLKQLEEHPLFAVFKAWQNKEGVVDFFHDLLRSREVEKK